MGCLLLKNSGGHKRPPPHQINGGCTKTKSSSATDPAAIRQSDILVSLGGPAATDHIFGGVHLGSSKDLRHAVNQIHRMLDNECIRGFASGDPSYYNTPENKKQTRFVIAEAEMQRYYQHAKSIIANNHDLLMAIAQALAKKRFLTCTDMQAILEKHPVRHVAPPLC